MPPLGSAVITATPPPRSEQNRVLRYERREVARTVTLRRSLRWCGYAIGDVGVGVEYDSLAAHLSGVGRCKSIHACPVCSAIIREGRAKEINTGLRVHLKRGGGGLFITLTLRHLLRDELAPRLAAISRAWHQILRGRPWEKRRDRLGYVGLIRAVEITIGANGWHPHVHAVLLFERPLTDAERAGFEEWVYGRWLSIVTRKGFGTITREHGVDVRPLTSAGIGAYVAKVQDEGWSAGRELARFDNKRKSPFTLLDQIREDGETRTIARWVEYVETTRGMRAIQWSPGLRVALLGHPEELTDEELVTVDAVSPVAWKYWADADWSSLGARGQAQRIALVQYVAAAFKAVGRSAGHPPPLDIGDPRAEGSRAKREVMH